MTNENEAIDETTLIVTMKDVRAAKGCSRGARMFCQTHGIDWNSFLKEGIPASVLTATGDAMALNLVKVAKNGRK